MPILLLVNYTWLTSCCFVVLLHDVVRRQVTFKHLVLGLISPIIHQQTGHFQRRHLDVCLAWRFTTWNHPISRQLPANMFNLRVDIRQALYRSQDLPERSRVGLNDLKTANFSYQSYCCCCWCCCCCFVMVGIVIFSLTEWSKTCLELKKNWIEL